MGVTNNRMSPLPTTMIFAAGFKIISKWSSSIVLDSTTWGGGELDANSSLTRTPTSTGHSNTDR